MSASEFSEALEADESEGTGAAEESTGHEESPAGDPKSDTVAQLLEYLASGPGHEALMTSLNLAATLYKSAVDERADARRSATEVEVQKLKGQQDFLTHQTKHNDALAMQEAAAKHTLESKRADSDREQGKHTIVLRAGGLLVLVLTVGLLTYLDKFPKEAAAAILSGVAGYLFGKDVPRQG